MARECKVEFMPYHRDTTKPRRTSELDYASRVQGTVNERLTEGWDFSCFLPGESPVGVTAVYFREVKNDDGVSHEPD